MLLEALEKKQYHNESLLRIPLIEHVYFDESVKKVLRGLDERWTQSGLFGKKSLGGFSPYNGKVFVANHSALLKWWQDPFSSARLYNDRDQLLERVMFLVHDYIHVWTCMWIRKLMPALGFTEVPITEDNLEDFVFCHMLTETAATMTDYWYFSTVNLNEICPIGTRMITLTVHYHERHRQEYLRYCPDLEIQTPAFFQKHNTFYCTGAFEGFSLTDIRESPMLRGWLEHEVKYGETQRIYTRQWLRFLGGLPHCEDVNELKKPLLLDQTWKQELASKIGSLLWEKIKEGKWHAVETEPSSAWETPQNPDLDFRFLNFNKVDQLPKDFQQLALFQRISCIDFAKAPVEMVRLIKHMVAHGEKAWDLHPLLNKAPRLPASEYEPEALFFLS